MTVKRYELSIMLKTDSPLHSGGVDEVVDPERAGLDREAVARRFARDAHDRPILTGRSIKGAVRSACKRFLQEHDAEQLAPALSCQALQSLWGDQGDGQQDGSPLRASALTFQAIRLPAVRDADTGNAEHTDGERATDSEENTLPEGQASRDGALPLRVGNAIDRYWGAVGDGALFEHEFLPAGNSLTLVIKAEGRVADEDATRPEYTDTQVPPSDAGGLETPEAPTHPRRQPPRRLSSSFL
ncbi:RAMP superfamily CRISPR-associated protein [Actinomyces ruminis]|uniref:CRISPR type III-associated protein domain-containing protein n=1 Tax=Actinomyces ruminis TaxID=1937003 RepID=A0ABX4MCJ8_9ACTO|nr:RAMP superfamily CRISPR-associated protein [Actinomyces ruminis]PHP52863.1 hypothetical protein BW737_006195 [Actinomyces ruminis]